MTARARLAGLLAAALPLARGAALAGGPAAGEPPRTIVLISVDDLRRDHLRPDLLPRLLSAAKSAVVFERASSQATWDLPSYASLLTSLYPSAHGAGSRSGPADYSQRSISANAVTLAQALKARGYRTEAYVGPLLQPPFGFARGFDVYREVDGDGRKGLRAAAEALRRADGPPLFVFAQVGEVERYANLPVDRSTGPFRCPIGWRERLPDRVRRPTPGSSSSPLCAADRRAYDRSVACADDALEGFLDALEHGAGGRDALVVLTSDHGEILCDRHPALPLRGHGFAGYAEQLDVPLLVWLPGRRGAGRRVADVAREIDVAPTLLELAHAPVPPGFQGRSLVPLLEGRSLPPVVTMAEGDDWITLRRGDEEYVRRAGAGEELYRLSGRSGEGRDLALDRSGDLLELRRAGYELPRRTASGQAVRVDDRMDQALKAGYRR